MMMLTIFSFLLFAASADAAVDADAGEHSYLAAKDGMSWDVYLRICPGMMSLIILILSLSLFLLLS